MHKRLMLVWSFAGAVMLGVAGLGFAQTGDRPLQKIFGGGSTKSGVAKAGEDTRRKVEIDVELAWLADPVTFPYFLEAHVDGVTLTVRGYIPDKLVREHALKLARLQTPLSVADALKEHPSLVVRTAKESPSQLQNAVAATLREALPKQSRIVQIECAVDGTVTLRGPAVSPEEKLAASHALRRLYGCTSVQNLMRLPGAPDIAQTTPSPMPKKDGKPSVPPAVSIGLPVPTTTGTEPAKKDETIKDPPAVPTVSSPKDKTPSTLAMSADKVSKLQKRILEVCPGAKDVKIEATAANKLQIELSVRSDDQITTFAGMIYGLPELADLRESVELHFTVAK
jgi:BON domain